MEEPIIEVLDNTEEELNKGYSECSRCGKPSGGKSRCDSCLDKLARKRKTPGTKERAWQHADQALRREKGSSGTTTGGHKSGHGDRQEIQSKMQAAEKKTGSKLSLDRKDNERGYESSNTRPVPQKLNVGRHNVDGKKLASWKKSLKKSEVTAKEFFTLLLLKADQQNDEVLFNLLQKAITSLDTLNK
jgi:hypothetical protein